MDNINCCPWLRCACVGVKRNIFVLVSAAAMWRFKCFNNKEFLCITHTVEHNYTGCLQKNGAVSKINKKFISHLTRAKRTPSAAATVRVSHALPAVRFSCLMRGRGASFQDGVAAGKGFLCAPF